MKRIIYPMFLAVALQGVALSQEIPVEPINPSQLTPDEARATQAVVQTPTSNVGDVYAEKFQDAPSTIPDSFLSKVSSTWRPTQDFVVKPKDNIMIAVGQGLMNTISTNLTMLTAKTNDETSTFEIDKGYLYVTVSSMNPISLVLYEEGVLESQVSITLVPVPAPPTIANINFELPQALKDESVAFQKKMKLEEEQQSTMEQGSQEAVTDPHSSRIIDILQPVARGEIPRGFGLTPDIPDHERFPCQISIYHRTEQRLVSGNDVVDVVLVKNDADRAYNIREEKCLSQGTLAVALFEKAYLQPGESSEIYILRDKRQSLSEKRLQKRPRLTEGE